MRSLFVFTLKIKVSIAQCINKLLLYNNIFSYINSYTLLDASLILRMMTNENESKYY